MKFLLALVTTTLFGSLLTIDIPSKASSFCEDIRGARVVAEDGTYLGKIDHSYEPDSIFNDYGTYGSKYSADSIWNKYGQYGGKYAVNSPFNKYTTAPPTIYTTNDKTAKLTVNKYLPYTVNPYRARACFE